jgi:gliding motility-associated-like protein
MLACGKSTVKKHGCEDAPLTGALCLPNVFTPNSDGINDTLFVRHSSGYPVIDTMEFRVFDGTGSILFYSSDINQGWDGSFNNKKKTGVYSVELTATLIGGTTIEYNGTITCLTDGVSDYVVENCTQCSFDNQFDGAGGFNNTLPTGESSGLCEGE